MTRAIDIRFHASLPSDLGAATPQQYGGIGMATTDRRDAATAERSAPDTAMCYFDEGVQADSGRRGRDLAKQKCAEHDNQDCRTPPPHALGWERRRHSLSVLLAIIRAADSLSLTLTYRRSAVVMAPSGIGVHSFFLRWSSDRWRHKIDGSFNVRTVVLAFPDRIPPLACA